MDSKTSSSRSGEREQFWRTVVSGQPRSGMSVAAWCGQHGVSAPSFYVWRRRLSKRGERPLERLPLVPVEILSPATDRSLVALEIELPSRVRVQVRSSCELELLRQVLTMLDLDQREAEGC